MATPPPPALGSPLPGATSRALSPGAEAAAIVLSPLDHGEGPQIGCLGDSGAGKTTAMREIVRAYLVKSPGVVLVVDDKERAPRFEGQCRKDRADLEANPIPAGYPLRTIVFRGDMQNAVDADAEDVAALAWDFARLGRPTLVVHDELNRPELAKNMQFRAGIKWVPASFAKGRAVGVGNLWGSQSPQDAPIAVFEQTTAILCFKLDGMGLAKLKQRGYLDGSEVESVIRSLHAMDAPPDQRGDFVILQRGQRWNGKVYKFAVSR